MNVAAGCRASAGLLSTLLVVACGGGRGVEPPSVRPNVLLVVLDTVRADALSCYGNPRPTTPILDQLAADGTRFVAAYASCFWTLPSHASLLTGHYPSAAGATSETNHLPATATTLAEHLAKAGYRTAAVVRNPWISAERGFDQGFEEFLEDWRDDVASEAEEERAAAATAASLMDGLAAGDAPFFLFVNLNIAHMPYTPPESTFAGFASERWPEPKIARLRSIKGGWGHLAGALRLDDADFRILRDLYEAEVAVADELVGELIEALGTLGLLDRTLVVVTSDHGENLGDHGMIDHVYSMFDTTVRVPLIVRYPTRFAAGGEVDELSSLIDIVPTVLDACGVEADGAEFAGMPLGERAAAASSAVFAENGRPINGLRLLRQEFPEFDAAALDHRIRMIRSGSHKLIWKTGVSAELFDLATDPGEQQDVESALPELRDRLLGELRAWSLGVEPRQPPGAFESRDQESLERLRALGYVE